jgi:hypothetical protein
MRPAAAERHHNVHLGGTELALSYASRISIEFRMNGCAKGEMPLVMTQRDIIPIFGQR